MMAKGSSLSICFFLSLIICSSVSGTLVGFSFSYQDRGQDAAFSSAARRTSFPKQNKISPSQISLILTDYRNLSTLSNSSVSVDFFLSRSLAEDFVASKSSAISWLRAYLKSFFPKASIKTIGVSCDRKCFSKEGRFSLLSILESIHSAIRTFRINGEIRVSVAFQLPFLEELGGTDRNKLHKILTFLRETRSFIIIQDTIDGGLSTGNQFTQIMTDRAILAVAVLPCPDVPFVLSIKTSPVPRPTELAKFTDELSKFINTDTQIRRRVTELYAEVHSTEDFAQEKLEMEEQNFRFLGKEILDNTSPTTPISTNKPVVAYPEPDNPTYTITVPSSANPVIATPNNPVAATIVPSTTPPTNPAITNPVTINPVTSYPPPPSNTSPVTNPANAAPITNPATSYPPPPSNASPVTNPANSPPISNPVTSYPPPTQVTNPVAPPAMTNAPAVSGQRWCVAKNDAPATALQTALDYACGMGKADCSQIQPGGSCYSPITLQNHASYAFNSYYQKNPVPTSCEFGGIAILVNTNPSSGSCMYPSSSSSTTSTPSSPTPSTSSKNPPPPPTPTTPSSPLGLSGSSSPTPPSALNSSNPALSGTMPFLGSGSPPGVNTSISSDSSSTASKPILSCVLVVASIASWKLSTGM